MNIKDIERLQAAGFTQAQIDEYINSQFDPSKPAGSGLPEIDLEKPSEALTNAQERGEDIIGVAPPVFGYETAFEIGPTVGKAALYGGGAYAGYKAAKGLVNRFVPGGGAMPTPKTGAVAPEVDAGGRRVMDFVQQRGQYAPPQASTPPAQPASQPNIVQRVTQMAYDKIAPAARAAAPYARAGIGALAALTPGNVGQNYPFPTSGPLQGQEINPQTGRPWTPQELEIYNTRSR